MSVNIVFQLSPEFLSDALVKKVTKKLQTNYKFKHLVKGNYIITPDLTGILSKDFIDYSKDDFLMLYLLSLYKYGVMNGYLKLVKVFTPGKLPPSTLLQLSSLIDYLTSNTNIIVIKPIQVVPHKLFQKKVVMINTQQIGSSGELILECLLKLPLNKLRSVFTITKTGEYYIVENGRGKKLFTIDYNLIKTGIFEKLNENLATPPGVVLLNHYINTGRLIKVEEYTPQGGLIRNFESLITGSEITHSIEVQGKIIECNSIRLNVDDKFNVDAEAIKQNYKLFKNLVTVNKYFAEKLYEQGLTMAQSYFNPSVEIIRKTISDAIKDGVDVNSIVRSDVDLMWRSVSIKGERVPFLILLRISSLMKNGEVKNKYFGVYNNLFNTNSLETRFFNVYLVKWFRKQLLKHSSFEVDDGFVELTTV